MSSEELAMTWLNEDPDRNLIYGAIYFKAMLNRPQVKGNYYSALSRYNVAERGVYTRSIRKYYRGISPGLKDRIETSQIPTDIHKVGLEHYEFQTEDLKCKVPTYDEGFSAFETLNGLVSDEDIRQDLIKVWRKNKYCLNRYEST
jgi:hypothetical protein